MPLPVITFAVQLPRLVDHARRDVVAEKAAAMSSQAQEAQEISESASEIYDRGVRDAFNEAEKLSMSRLMRVEIVPVDSLRCRAVRLELGSVVCRDLLEDRSIDRIVHVGYRRMASASEWLSRFDFRSITVSAL